MSPFSRSHVALVQVSDVYRKIRFTVRFLLGNLQDFDPTSDAVAYEVCSDG